MNVIFKIALYPEGVSDFHYEELDFGDGKIFMERIDDDEVFEEHLCKSENSDCVLDELNNIYKHINDIYKITNLKFEGNGIFSCNVITDVSFDNEDEMYNIIKELLWPADIHDVGYLFIKNKFHYIILEVDEINFI